MARRRSRPAPTREESLEPTCRACPACGRAMWAAYTNHRTLVTLDSHWREHLAAMDYLRQGIHLRSYAQKNPKQEYKREAFELFTSMLDRIKHDTVSVLSRMQLRTQAEIDAEEEERQRRLARAMQFQHAAPEQITASPAQQGPVAEPQQRPAPEPVAQFVRETKKVGRNEPCPCGSGKKYKHCHGALAKEG